jgi:hypothetical protein
MKVPELRCLRQRYASDSSAIRFLRVIFCGIFSYEKISWARMKILQPVDVRMRRMTLLEQKEMIDCKIAE